MRSTDVLAEPDLAAHAAAETADEPTQVEPSPPQSKDAGPRSGPRPRRACPSRRSSHRRSPTHSLPPSHSRPRTPRTRRLSIRNPRYASKRAMPAEPSRPSPTTGGSAPAQVAARSPSRVADGWRWASWPRRSRRAAFSSGSSGGEEQDARAEPASREHAHAVAQRACDVDAPDAPRHRSRDSSSTTPWVTARPRASRPCCSPASRPRAPALPASARVPRATRRRAISTTTASPSQRHCRPSDTPGCCHAARRAA